MRRVLLTASAVIRTPCNTGCPPPLLPAPEPRPSSDAAGLAAAAADVAVAPEEPVPAPKPDPEPKPDPVPEELRGPPIPPEDEDGLLVFSESRSLAVPYTPDPGAIWLSALSSR